jgi:hypothetical protein
MRQLLLRAQLLALRKGSSTIEPDHLLEAIVGIAGGLEVLSRPPGIGSKSAVARAPF